MDAQDAHDANVGASTRAAAAHITIEAVVPASERPRLILRWATGELHLANLLVACRVAARLSLPGARNANHLREFVLTKCRSLDTGASNATAEVEAFHLVVRTLTSRILGLSTLLLAVSHGQHAAEALRKGIAATASAFGATSTGFVAVALMTAAGRHVTPDRGREAHRRAGLGARHRQFRLIGSVANTERVRVETHVSARIGADGRTDRVPCSTGVASRSFDPTAVTASGCRATIATHPHDTHLAVALGVVCTCDGFVCVVSVATAARDESEDQQHAPDRRRRRPSWSSSGPS